MINWNSCVYLALKLSIKFIMKMEDLEDEEFDFNKEETKYGADIFSDEEDDIEETVTLKNNKDIEHEEIIVQ